MVLSLDMDALVTRAIAGAGLALSLVLGGWVSSRLSLDLGDAVDVAMARRVDPNQAQRKALAQQASYQDSPEFYQTHIDDAVQRYNLKAPSLDRLREPNTFYHVASEGDAKIVAPGAALSEAGFTLTVVVQDISVERRGVRTTNQHTLAMVRNVGDKPLAYFLHMRSRTGDCNVRAVTRYDAMVLLPGEEAEISVCSGSHEVEITDLRLMEVTELGALWVSKVPPQAVGHDEVISRSHFAGEDIEMCAEVPAVEFAGRLSRGEAQWEDIVDFYSRHDCEHYRWWPGYQRIVDPLESLPAMAK